MLKLVNVAYLSLSRCEIVINQIFTISGIKNEKCLESIIMCFMIIVAEYFVVGCNYGSCWALGHVYSVMLLKYLYGGCDYFEIWKVNSHIDL